MSSLLPEDGRTTSQSVCTYLEVPGDDTRPGTALSTDIPEAPTPDVTAGAGFSDAVLKAIQANRLTPADSLKVNLEMP